VIAITVYNFTRLYYCSMGSISQPTRITPGPVFGRLFADLSAETNADFERIVSRVSLPPGTVLFREGTPASGVFIILDGKAKLSLCSQGGRSVNIWVAAAGAVLGLSAVLSGKPHETTAELLDRGEIAVVQRRDLVNFLHQHREACLQVVNLLSQDLHVAYDRVRSLGLSRSRRPSIQHLH
jgi:CRP/FNR family transcriptional regulator